MVTERQKTWGNLVILDMFLGGTGAGVFAISFIIQGLMGPMPLMTQVGTLLGPILMVLGLFCLLLELGSPKNAYRILRGFASSWMSRGALLQGLFILFGLAYAVPSLWYSNWQFSGGLIFGVLAFILAIVGGAYYGIFLGKSKGVALWTSAVLPLASLLISLCSGTGFLLLLTLGFANFYSVEEVIYTLRSLGLTAVLLIIAEFVLIWSLVNANPGVTYSQAVNAMRKPLLVVGSFLAVSLIVLFLSFRDSGINVVLFFFLISGILLLAAGYGMRSAIIKSGFYYSLHIPS